MKVERSEAGELFSSTLDHTLASLGGSAELANILLSVFNQQVLDYAVAYQLWTMRRHSDPFTRSLLKELGFPELAVLLDDREAFVLLSRLPRIQAIATNPFQIANLLRDLMSVTVTHSIRKQSWLVTEDLSHLGERSCCMGDNWVLGRNVDSLDSRLVMELGPVQAAEEQELVKRKWIIAKTGGRSSIITVNPGSKLKFLEVLLCPINYSLEFRLIRYIPEPFKWRLADSASRLGYTTVLWS
jgi:hypothetical protein